MLAVRVLVFVAGLSLVAWTLLSAVRTVVLPRASRTILTGAVFRGLAKVFNLLAGERASYARRDRVWALYAPLGLLLMVFAWVVLVIAGFTAMEWALENEGFSRAFWFSGSSLLTLGFAPADTFWERLLAFSEATIGLGLVALLIAFLPALYSSFQRRERKVAELEVRAGTPPSSVVFVLRQHRIGWLQTMGSSWLDWERWFIEMQEAHTSYPALVFFRSPVPDHHWVTAAATILDAAALTVSSLDLPPQPEAQVCIRAGFLSLRRMADFFGIEYDPDPQAGDPISISRDEFERVFRELAEAGCPVKDDVDEAWREWSGWRATYDAVLLQLAELTIAPYAPWTSDRSIPSASPPGCVVGANGSRPGSLRRASRGVAAPPRSTV